MYSHIFRKVNKMNKILKAAGMSLLLAGSIVLLDCGGSDKPAAANASTSAAVGSASQQAPAEKPIPTSKLYRFGVHIKDKSQIPAITPEVTAEFEKAAANFALPARDLKHGIEGIWVYKASPMSKSAQFHTHWWTLNLEGHHATRFEYDDKGKLKQADEQHIGHIQITVDAKTNQMKSVSVYRFDLTKDNPQGTRTEISRQKF